MDNTALYRERFTRIKKTIALEPVDRLPLIFMGTAFSARYNGITIAEYCRDPKVSLYSNLKAMDRLGGWDGANIAAGGRITVILSMMWMSRLAVPGRDLPPDSMWQVQEAEVMKVEDYDAILNKGWNRFVNSYMPRVLPTRELMGAMLWLMLNGKRVGNAYKKRGYVIVGDAFARGGLPFESLCGARSMTKFFADLYRIPDKVQAVMDVILEEAVAGIKKTKPPAGGIGGAWLGGWRSASALVAPKLWDRFVWPYLVTLANAMIDQGMIPILHWDQDWTRDLARLQELPAKKCILNADGMTDMHKFVELVGDRMAMLGDVPASLLAAGTPDDVRNYVRDRVELFEGKGLLICPGCDAPINAKAENMEALVQAAYDYGTTRT
jgi:uroporphyrinogen-III decarboxylase